MKRSLSLTGGALCAAGVLLAAASASAHIDMLGALKSRGGDQKAVPCDGARSAGPVYTFEPGATITIGITEGVKHPGYFRIAFDSDGQDFKEPASIAPLDKDRAGPNKKCMDSADDKCGQSDFCNAPEVLWDNIDPHLNAESPGTYTWTFKLPDVECTNCTLQVLQIMEDSNFHQEYCPQGSCANSCTTFCDKGGLQDIYHRCINVTLKKGAGTSGPGNAAGAAIKVGTIGTKYPKANIECSKANVGDAGTGTPDSGAGGDAGVGNDAGAQPSTGGAAGGTTGTAGGGGAAQGGAAGGTATAGGGAVQGGAAGGTGTAGGGGAPGGAPGGSAGTAGGTTGGAGAPTTAGGVAGGAPTTNADDDDASCSVAFGSNAAGGATLGVFVLTGLALARRRRRA